MTVELVGSTCDVINKSPTIMLYTIAIPSNLITHRVVLYNVTSFRIKRQNVRRCSISLAPIDKGCCVRLSDPDHITLLVLALVFAKHTACDEKNKYADVHHSALLSMLCSDVSVCMCKLGYDKLMFISYYLHTFFIGMPL